MKLLLDIAVESSEWDGFDSIEALAETALHAAAEASQADIPAGAEVSLLLCDDAFIRGLNQKWRGIDKPTNVLSFPTEGPGGDVLLGDIIIAHGTARREAEEEGKPLRDHVSHLIVHGFLHLIGYDHLVAEEAEEMEEMERAILAKLGIRDPYLGAVLQIAERS